MSQDDEHKQDDQDSNLRGLTGAGIAIGAALGVALGVATDNIAIGIGIGIALGIAFSAAAARRRDDSDS
jgi:hypothetical protein